MSPDTAISKGENFHTLTDLPTSNSRSWISVGLPNSHFAATSPSDIFWCPNGLPQGKSLFVASSRLGRDLSKHSQWFDAFRTLACRIRLRRQFVVTAEKTTADRFVRRASDHFGFSILDLTDAPRKANHDWFLQTSKSKPNNHFPCFRIPFSGSKEILPRDKLLAQIAIEIRVLLIRAGGSIERILLDHYRSPSTTRVFLHNTSHSSSSVYARLIELGAHPWLVYGGDRNQPTGKPVQESHTKSSASRIPIVKQLPPGKFLIHCTRPRMGPWPDQTNEDYIDDLIFQRSGADHSARSTLTRILATGQIVASKKLTRSQQRVVCFTEIPLEEITQHQKFQSHLGRWDFLPIGVAIRESAMRRIGAKPVIYGDESIWMNLDEDQKPFFQIARSTTRTGKLISWEDEREWRVVGNLDLAQFSEGEIFAFDNL